MSSDMHITIVGAPIEGTSDARDPAKQPLRLGWHIGGDEDFIVIHREWGEQFQDGVRTHLWSGGIWHSMTVEDVVRALAVIEDPSLVGLRVEMVEMVEEDPPDGG